MVCGSTELRTRLRVAGDAGPDGLIPTTDRFGAALADIVRCGRCGHMQLERFPAESELATAYEQAASDDYIEEEAGQRETARRSLEAIERHVAPGALLDVGCWVGFLMAEAETRGWQTTGIEPSDFASAFARGRLGLDVRTVGLFEAELPVQAYDAIVLGDVFEHLRDPGRALDRIKELLAPYGIVSITVPDAGSRLARAMGRRWWSVIPTHLQYFTRASAQEILRRHGLEVVETATSPKAFTVRYYLDRISGYSSVASGALVRAAEATGRADRIWAPDFRDRVTLLAREAG